VVLAEIVLMFVAFDVVVFRVASAVAFGVVRLVDESYSVTAVGESGEIVVLSPCGIPDAEMEGISETEERSSDGISEGVSVVAVIIPMVGTSVEEDGMGVGGRVANVR